MRAEFLLEAIAVLGIPCYVLHEVFLLWLFCFDVLNKILYALFLGMLFVKMFTS